MEVTPIFLLNIIWALSAVAVIQLVVCLTLFAGFRSLRREASALLKETHGTVRKIEGLTASKREQFNKQYEKLFEQLTSRVPTTIAAHASTSIFETERKILMRLAELEPQLKTDDLSRRKLDELIKSMESLEENLVSITAESVRKILTESRGDFLSDEDSLAA